MAIANLAYAAGGTVALDIKLAAGNEQAVFIVLKDGFRALV